MTDELHKMLKAQRWWQIKKTFEKELLGKKPVDRGYFLTDDAFREE